MNNICPQHTVSIKSSLTSSSSSSHFSSSSQLPVSIPAPPPLQLSFPHHHLFHRRHPSSLCCCEIVDLPRGTVGCCRVREQQVSHYCANGRPQGDVQAHTHTSMHTFFQTGNIEAITPSHSSHSCAPLTHHFTGELASMNNSDMSTPGARVYLETCAHTAAADCQIFHLTPLRDLLESSSSEQ